MDVKILLQNIDRLTEHRYVLARRRVDASENSRFPASYNTYEFLAENAIE